LPDQQGRGDRQLTSGLAIGSILGSVRSSGPVRTEWHRLPEQFKLSEPSHAQRDCGADKANEVSQ
jgi:hypothetical protein